MEIIVLINDQISNFQLIPNKGVCVFFVLFFLILVLCRYHHSELKAVNIKKDYKKLTIITCLNLHLLTCDFMKV